MIIKHAVQTDATKQTHQQTNAQEANALTYLGNLITATGSPSKDLEAGRVAAFPSHPGVELC